MQIKTETIVGLFILSALSIFFYMTFQIGVFRLDRASYAPYVVYFEDVSGLQKKADVKISGVKVGWVDEITLLKEDNFQAQATIMVLKQYKLHEDASAIVRQDGLLGSKYLEISPGSSLSPSLASGAALTRPGKPPVNVDELFQKVRKIANNVEDITASIKNVVSGQGTDELKSMVSNFTTASSHLAAFSQTLDRTLMNNENNLNAIVGDLKIFAHDIRTGWPDLQKNIDKISQTIDRDLDRFVGKFESTADAVQAAADQFRDGVKNIGEVAQKINEGKGLLGKLVTEDETYSDIKYAVQGVKNYFAKIERLGLVFDAHSESMWGVAEHYVDHLQKDIQQKDSKGYFGFRIHPNEDTFYLLQGVSTRKGWVERFTTHQRYSDSTAQLRNMCATGPIFELQPTATLVKVQDPECKETTILHRGGRLKLNIQMAKIFGDLALRFGLFENTAGAAIDYDMPLHMNDFRWITSLEAYDFYGDDRIRDQRPHFKWINRLFMFNNLYMTFGADDFISKHNANAFFGVGFRFVDDDVKYLLSKFGLPNIG